jgi:hypothetical protein
MSRFYYYIFDGNKLRKISKKEAKESCQFFRAINMKVVLENLEPISEKSGKVKSSLLEEFEVGEKYVLRTAEHSLNGLVVSKSFSNADFLGTEIVSKEVYFYACWGDTREGCVFDFSDRTKKLEILSHIK